MKKRTLIFLFSFSLILAPLVIFAAPGDPVGGGPTGCTSLASNPKFQDLICYVVDGLLSAVVPFIFALAIVMFVWGVVRYVIGASDEKERERGKQFMIWGIIALVVMVSVWGLVHVFTNTFNLGFGIPQVQQ